MPLLEVRGLTKRFGGLTAVDDVSFSVDQGAIKAVIGPNGAGKTTLFNLIAGSFPADQGAIDFRGTAITGLRPHQVARRGIARTFQHIRLFPGMTALENIMVGAHVHGKAGIGSAMLRLPWTRREQRTAAERCRELMDFLGIADLAEVDATDLAYGQQRTVELARALALEPTLLLLDEPAAGLNMRETADVGRMIGKIRERGITVLIVEHDVSLVMNISDEILVLSYGRKIAEDEPLAIQKNDDVIRVYLGDDDA